MRKASSWTILLLSLFLVLSGITSIALSSTPAKKKEAEQKAAPAPKPPQREVLVIEIDDPITPVTAEYIIRAIDRATERNAEALIIQLDTPGGLVESTREIVKKMLAAEVPTVVYVAPSGARAASAGVFITLTANVAAMAPNTRIGSASPVQMEGKMDETMAKKVTNDLAAMVRGIAEKRGRNAKWAEDAVRKSVSATEKEALDLKVIDLIAPDLATLVKTLDGRTVDVVIGKRTIRTADAKVVEQKMGLRSRILGIITNPNVAYILMILGFYGLYFELSNPGAIFPGVAGAICLILAFYALQTLPINYAGLMLILLAIGLFIAEAFVTSHGVLGIGGAVAMLFGSLMLIDVPSLRISWAVILPVVAFSSLLFIVTVTLAVRVHHEKVDTGREGLIGLRGEARSDLDPEGQVFVHGEYWSARSPEPVRKGDAVIVTAVDGLKLTVKKAGDHSGPSAAGTRNT